MLKHWKQAPGASEDLCVLPIYIYYFYTLELLKREFPRAMMRAMRDARCDARFREEELLGAWQDASLDAKARRAFRRPFDAWALLGPRRPPGAPGAFSAAAAAAGLLAAGSSARGLRGRLPGEGPARLDRFGRFIPRWPWVLFAPGNGSTEPQLCVHKTAHAREMAASTSGALWQDAQEARGRGVKPRKSKKERAARTGSSCLEQCN